MQRIPIGPCQLYWDNRKMGSAKSQVAFNYSGTEALQKNMESIGDIGARKTYEALLIECVIANLPSGDLPYLFGAATSLTSLGTVDPTSTSAEIRKTTEITMTGTDTQSLGETTVSDVVVTTLDFVTEYTLDTDYSLTTAAGTVARIGGDIADGDVVLVAFNFTDSSAVTFNFGGKEGMYEAELKLVWQFSNGKKLQFTGHRAIRVGDHSWTFPEDDYAEFPVSFKILSDLTKAKGNQLGEWIYEA